MVGKRFASLSAFNLPTVPFKCYLHSEFRMLSSRWFDGMAAFGATANAAGGGTNGASLCGIFYYPKCVCLCICACWFFCLSLFLDRLAILSCYAILIIRCWRLANANDVNEKSNSSTLGVPPNWSSMHLTSRKRALFFFFVRTTLGSEWKCDWMNGINGKCLGRIKRNGVIFFERAIRLVKTIRFRDDDDGQKRHRTH